MKLLGNFRILASINMFPNNVDMMMAEITVTVTTVYVVVNMQEYASNGLNESPESFSEEFSMLNSEEQVQDVVRESGI